GWKWVLRSASATRPILQWRGGKVVNASAPWSPDSGQPRPARVRVEMTTGGRPAGSVSNTLNVPATAVSYDQPLGPAGRLLLAGSMSFAPAAGVGNSVALATIWAPSGEYGRGPETTVVVRQGGVEPGKRSVRQLRAEHSERISLGGNLAVEYGAEYLMAAGPHSQSASLRPSGRVIMQFSPTWIAALSLETEPGTYAIRNRAYLQSA